MKKITKTVAKCFVLCAVVFVLPTRVLSAKDSSEYIAGQLIVKLNTTAEKMTEENILITSESLAALNKKYSLISIEPLFSTLADIKDIANRFIQRAQRAPFGVFFVSSSQAFEPMLSPAEGIKESAPYSGSEIKPMPEDFPAMPPGVKEWFAEKRKGIKIPDLSNIYVLTFPKGSDMREIASAYTENTDVLYAEPNYEVTCLTQPDEPLLNNQWAIEKIKADKAWEINTGSNNVVTAVLDSGIDTAHPELTTCIWINLSEKQNKKDDDKNGFIDDTQGYNFIANNADIQDRYGHGTFVAGVIGAKTLNKTGIAGINWYSKIMPVKVISDEGKGDIISLAKGILYAADNGADILNLSVGTRTKDSFLLKELLDYSSFLCCLIIAAAGNDNQEILFSPAGYENVITVSASDKQDKKAEFANKGDKVDIVAPGVDILSLRAKDTRLPDSQIVDEDYIKASGTSASAAYVSGVVSLMLSVNPTLYTDEIKAALQATAERVEKDKEEKYIGSN
ncbi:MAG: S8 family serine peptidase [Candidatus Omnitrophota bacterium]